MIRFTWLRFRNQAAVAAGALIIAAVALTVTGLRLEHAYDTTIATCGQQGDCAVATSQFPPSPYGAVASLLNALVIAIPALMGMFWGAPLVARELEAGTFRLAWTQGVTRVRWLAVKMGVIGVLAMATAGLASLMVTWWSSPIEMVAMNRFTPGVFHAGGIVPVGYAAFALALGVTAGLLTRRTLPAMAITLVIFAAVQLAVPLLVRPHLFTPVRSAATLSVASLKETGATNVGSAGGGHLFVQAPPDLPGAWILSDTIATPAGQPASSLPAGACGRDQSRQACYRYIESLHLRQVVTYQPAGRYWATQWYETAIYLALALILAGLCFLRIRPRPAPGAGIRHPGASQRAPAAGVSS